MIKYHKISFLAQELPNESVGRLNLVCQNGNEDPLPDLSGFINEGGLYIIYHKYKKQIMYRIIKNMNTDHK